MALPTAVDSALSKVRSAAEGLSAAERELVPAKRSGDEDRMKRAQATFSSKASELKSAGKALVDAASGL